MFGVGTGFVLAFTAHSHIEKGGIMKGGIMH